MGVDILQLWRDAGPFAKGVVIVLLIMSFLSLTIALNKLWQVHKSSKATRKFAPQFSRAIQEEQLDQAITLAEKNQGSHVAMVLGALSRKSSRCCATGPPSPRPTSIRPSARWSGRC